MKKKHFSSKLLGFWHRLQFLKAILCIVKFTVLLEDWPILIGQIYEIFNLILFSSRIIYSQHPSLNFLLYYRPLFFLQMNLHSSNFLLFLYLKRLLLFFQCRLVFFFRTVFFFVSGFIILLYLHILGNNFYFFFPRKLFEVKKQIVTCTQ